MNKHTVTLKELLNMVPFVSWLPVDPSGSFQFSVKVDMDDNTVCLLHHQIRMIANETQNMQSITYIIKCVHV